MVTVLIITLKLKDKFNFPTHGIGTTTIHTYIYTCVYIHKIMNKQ